MNAALAIVLFIVGIGIIVLEVLVPSFGLFTLMSIAALIGSVLLAFGESTPFGIGILVAAFVLVPTAIALGFRLLTTTRLGDNLLLRAPDDPAAIGEIYERNRQLIGRTGTAVTPLRPAGTADFDGERIPVVTEGELIDGSTVVEVVAVEGNRIVVRAVPASSSHSTPSVD